MDDSFFPEDVSEAMAPGGEWIKASEFEGDGLNLKAVKVEKVMSNDPQYGAEVDDMFVERGVLKVGETLRYNFLTPEGVERKIDSTSMPLFVGFKKAEVQPGDWVSVKRTGKAKNTRYTIEKIDQPAAQPVAPVVKEAPKTIDYPKEPEIDASSIPF